MGDEQQSGPVELGAQVPVVEGGDDRLAGTGGGDDEVVRMVPAALDFETFEDLALERVGLDLERGDDRVPTRRGCSCTPEAFVVERFEVGVGPVGGEGAVEGGDEVRVVPLRGAYVPFEAGDLRREGEVRRPDIDRREAACTVEHPGLRVQSGGGGVVGDLDLSAEISERFEGPELGAAGVGGGDDPQRLAGLDMAAKVGKEVTDSGPADERQHEVDPIGGVDLGFDLGADCWLVAGVGHQHRVSQRREGPADVKGLVGGSQPFHGCEPLQGGREHALGLEDAALGTVDCRENRSGEAQRRIGPIVDADGREGVAHPTTEDLPDPVGQLGGIDSLEIGPEPVFPGLVETSAEQLVDQLVMETGLQVRHGTIVAQCPRTAGDR